MGRVSGLLDMILFVSSSLWNECLIEIHCKSLSRLFLGAHCILIIVSGMKGGKGVGTNDSSILSFGSTICG